MLLSYLELFFLKSSHRVFPLSIVLYRPVSGLWAVMLFPGLRLRLRLRLIYLKSTIWLARAQLTPTTNSKTTTSKDLCMIKKNLSRSKPVHYISSEQPKDTSVTGRCKTQIQKLLQDIFVFSYKIETTNLFKQDTCCWFTETIRKKISSIRYSRPGYFIVVQILPCRSSQKLFAFT